jgi:Armadillo/beta-catenin-like repeat
VDWINSLRDVMFIHASLSGIQSLNYLAWPVSFGTKSIVISTLASNVIFVSIAMAIYFYLTARNTEYTASKAMLNIEWQVIHHMLLLIVYPPLARQNRISIKRVNYFCKLYHPCGWQASAGVIVDSRALEPVITLTLSKNPADLDVAKKLIPKLVSLLSFDNMRVQFQAAWAIANLALIDDETRLKIHDEGATKKLFDGYATMEEPCRLEVLAAMVSKNGLHL